MEFDELVAALVGVAPDSEDPSIDWDQRGVLWRQLAAQAQYLMGSVAPGAFCTAQDWDNRVDCAVKMPNGDVVGEMVSLRELSHERLYETAERLRRKVSGEPVELVSEIRAPTYIGGPLPEAG